LLAIAAGVAAYSNIGLQSFPEATSSFKFSIAGPRDFERLCHRDSKQVHHRCVDVAVSPQLLCGPDNYIHLLAIEVFDKDSTTL
jgi:hypothetical protein